MNILIAGGGIGGLAAAIACANAGHQVTVLERNREFTEIGAGIQLAPNAFHALDHLGVGAPVKQLAVLIDELRLMDGPVGGEITRLMVGEEYEAVFGNPYMVVHRTDLYHPLLHACRDNPSIKLVTSCRVEGYSQDTYQARLDLAGGEHLWADAVLGADGIRSAIRRQLIGDGDPKVSGHTIYRSVVPMETVPEELRWNAVTLWAGPRWHFVHYPIAGGKYMNLAATVDNQATKPIVGKSVNSELVEGLFDGLNDQAKRLVKLGEDWKEWVLCDRDPVDCWTDGRVTLIGDAAHPMLQYAAQGACMALEDAVLLGELLKGASTGDVASVLSQYNLIRKDRTAKVVEAARDMGRNIYHASGHAAVQRNVMFQSMTSNELHLVLGWLHGARPPFNNASHPETRRESAVAVGAM
ncbi:3-hydroxybenzoate 6-monooxygenase [Sedimenticola sp.]|uniref:3-hydroxybenzoate 6-monooxygenase n=1 Tax=Sedimenticola sp. TaxID=1940285 RepID=UPI003D0AC385